MKCSSRTTKRQQQTSRRLTRSSRLHHLPVVPRRKHGQGQSAKYFVRPSLSVVRHYRMGTRASRLATTSQGRIECLMHSSQKSLIGEDNSYKLVCVVVELIVFITERFFIHPSDRRIYRYNLASSMADNSHHTFIAPTTTTFRAHGPPINAHA